MAPAAAVELDFGLLHAPGAKEGLGTGAGFALGDDGAGGVAEAHAGHAFDAAHGPKRFEVESHDGVGLGGDPERDARARVRDAERGAASVLEKVGRIGRVFDEAGAERAGGRAREDSSPEGLAASHGMAEGRDAGAGRLGESRRERRFERAACALEVKEKHDGTGRAAELGEKGHDGPYI